MATFKFKADEVKRLVDHCKAAPTHDKYWGEVVGPSLLLVGDRGVYLMSNGLPGDLLDPSKKDAKFASRFVAYADGIDPNKNEDWYEEKREKFGGDDGADPLPLAWFEKALFTGKTFVTVRCTATKVEVVL